MQFYFLNLKMHQLVSPYKACLSNLVIQVLTECCVECVTVTAQISQTSHKMRFWCRFHVKVAYISSRSKNCTKINMYKFLLHTIMFKPQHASTRENFANDTCVVGRNSKDR
jgi:hypothetical protein